MLSIAKFLTRESDPYALGLLACSLAYQSALASAVKEIASDPSMRKCITSRKAVRLHRNALGEKEEPQAFTGFRLTSMLGHPLVRRADDAVYAFTSALGYPEELQRRVIEGVHVRLPEQFRTLISDGGTSRKSSIHCSGFWSSAETRFRPTLHFSATFITSSGGSRIPGARRYRLFKHAQSSWTGVRAAGLRHAGLGRNPRVECKICDRTWHDPFDEDFGVRTSLSTRMIELVGRPTSTTRSSSRRPLAQESRSRC